jgi:hypothetical protein
MATRKTRTGSSPHDSTVVGIKDFRSPVLYIHGIGPQLKPPDIKREWDLALFGKEMGKQTTMVYWADVLHRDEPAKSTQAIGTDRETDISKLLAEADVDVDNQDAQFLAAALAARAGIPASDSRKKVLPFPAPVRRFLARQFLEFFVKDTAAYFFRPGVRDRIRRRLSDRLKNVGEPVTIVAHSQGTIITLEVLATLAKNRPAPVQQLVTIGSPLGIQEVQDFLSCPLEVPNGIEAWHNFADPVDVVALDKGLGNDFRPGGFIKDDLTLNTSIWRNSGYSPHLATGYLAHAKVRDVVHRTVRFDAHARCLMSRDVAADLAVDARHSVLIEVLEPGYGALGESSKKTLAREKKEKEAGQADLATRIERTAKEIEVLVGPGQLEAASVDRLRRFVSARLTPAELNEVARRHEELRVYRLWKSTAKAKLLKRSARVIQADAAWASYSAFGKGVTWAVLDTGVRRDHPHFREHSNIAEVYDCTKTGSPTPVPDDLDRDGHGTHVSGIIAGTYTRGAESIQGIAPCARLVVYKVFNAKGQCEDAWIIKALDHIAEYNEGKSEDRIQGVNLSLGGPYDGSVYGCGFTPVCTELRRLWRSGVLVVVSSGNEGQVLVNTPYGEMELNSPMSIGDPANLEDCIAVGSVNADMPHLYGISSFSSRGPTSDGRLKPDVVAPGDGICSCDSRYNSLQFGDLYCILSGTSMAAPHVSGLLAAFLSVRPEYRGRPDEVKEILLRTCTDIERDRYHQGHGIPNLMKMLLET